MIIGSKKKRAHVKPFQGFADKFQEILKEDTRDFIDYFYSQSGDAYVSLRRPIGQEWTKEEIAENRIWKFKKLAKQKKDLKEEMDLIEDYFKTLHMSDPIRKQFLAEKSHIFEQIDENKRVYRKAYYKSPELEFEEEYDSKDPNKCFKYVKPEGGNPVILRGKDVKSQQERLPMEHPEIEPLGSGLDTKFKQFCIIAGQKNDEIREFIMRNNELTVGQLVKKAIREGLL